MRRAPGNIEKSEVADAATFEDVLGMAEKELEKRVIPMLKLVAAE